MQKKMKFNEMYNTPLRPMYSEIWPLAIAPIMAPTFDNEPNTENWFFIFFSQIKQCQSIAQKRKVKKHNEKQKSDTPLRLRVSSPWLFLLA